MIASLLVLGAAVGQTQVEQVIGPAAQPEGMPTKPRAAESAPGAGAPAISAVITPSENSTPSMTVYCPTRACTSFTCRRSCP